MSGGNRYTYPVTEEYLARVFESSPVALVSIDTRLRIIMFNRTAQKLTGYGGAEVIGRRIGKLLQPRRFREIVAELRTRGGASIEGYATRIKGSDNREIPVRLRISSLYSSRDELLGFIVMALDLGEVETIQAKLLEAERLAAITETAISINHEINNPLCAILGNTQLMLMEGDRLDPRIVKKLRSIERQIARIQGVAKRLSRITRPAVTEYVGGATMLDVERSEIGEPAPRSPDKK